MPHPPRKIAGVIDMTVDTSSTWSTLQVGNVPLDTSRYQLEHFFSDIGPVKKCFIVKPREGKQSTIGFVTFTMQDDCKAALDMEAPKLGEHELSLKMAPDKKVFGDKKQSGGVGGGQEPASRISKNKARLVIRNLSFKATQDGLRDHFTKYGPVVDVNILKKPDGKMVGCAFVEFKRIESATEAVKGANGSKFINRPIAVDWAVPKEVFASLKEVKEEEIKEEIKEEDIKEEEKDGEMDVDIKDEEESDESEEEEEDMMEKDDEQESDDDEE